MSLKYLGQTLDIHGGGQDLIFPHHENEIAQSESYTGVKPFVRYWMHNGLLQLSGEKMSKSLGNLITIKDALQKYSADAIRIFILSSHYRSPLTYSEEALEAAERGAERLRQAAQTINTREGATEKIDLETYRNRFIEAMDDDFNTAQALAALFDLARGINRASEEGFGVSQAQRALIDLAGILGLTLKIRENLPDTPEKLLAIAEELRKSSTANVELVNSTLAEPNRIGEENASRVRSALLKVENTSKDIAERIKEYKAPSTLAEKQGVVLYNTCVANTDAQIYLRTQLRQAKLWQVADELRTKLGELGIVLEDTPTGTVWKYKRGEAP
jgi:cysteinyl-tRNA synthetase